MIHEIGVELHAALRDKGLAIPVVDGPEPTTTTTYARERIVIGYDEDAGDAFGPVRGTKVNPKHRMTIRQACKLTIYAQSVRAGALAFEHRRRARAILDQVLVALGLVAGARRNAWTPTGGRFVQPEDLAESARIGGAVYELKFTFDRAVMVRTWAGEARPEATIGAGGIGSTTRVSLAQGDDPDNPPDSAETACGG